MEKNSPGNPGVAAGLVKVALIAFVGVSVGFGVYRIVHTPPELGKFAEPVRLAAELLAAAPAPAAARQKTAPASKTAIVYYFYPGNRCPPCRTIEGYTRAAVEKNFASDYKGWRVSFKGVNTGESGNAHFAQDYGLDPRSLVVQKFADGKPLGWGRLDKAWQLLGSQEAFTYYVTAETCRLLDEGAEAGRK